MKLIISREKMRIGRAHMENEKFREAAKFFHEAALEGETPIPVAVEELFRVIYC